MPQDVIIPAWALILLGNALVWAISVGLLLYKIGRWVERIEGRLQSGGETISAWKAKAEDFTRLEERVKTLEGEREAVKLIPVLQTSFENFAVRVERDIEGVRADMANIAAVARAAVADSLKPLAEVLRAKLAAA